MKLIYLTGNWAKIKQAKLLFEPLGIEIDNKKIEVPEIQADHMEEVARYSAKWASDELKENVLANDTGLIIKALNGFPCVYTHYVSDTIGEDGILKLMEGKEDREACFSQTLAYCEYGKEPVTFTSVTKGTIAKKKEGTFGWTWDFIFIPDGKDKALGCFEDEERFAMWNDECYYLLADYLKKKEETYEHRIKKD